MQVLGKGELHQKSVDAGLGTCAGAKTVPVGKFPGLKLSNCACFWGKGKFLGAFSRMFTRDETGQGMPCLPSDSRNM